MVNIVPNYYYKFQCIADRCKHNCCIGWEIDIDEETFEFYNNLDTPLGEKIRANITGNTPHFKLTEGDKCPLLLENGLCQIILEYGEDAICDICYLHPRFKNFYSSFTETGLGLSCCEAARIILFEKEKFLIEKPENVKLLKEEEKFFSIREGLFSLLTDRKNDIYERFSKLAIKFGFEFNFSLKKLRNVYLSLERLEDEWTEILDQLDDYEFDGMIFKDKTFQIMFEQLAVYFIFRHLSGAIYDKDYAKRVKFALVSCYFIGRIIELYKPSCQEEIIDIVRMYSAEIEYSEENTEAIMNI